MTDNVKSGFAFHAHHDKLVEWCSNYDMRATYIVETKPKDEVDLRLKLFKFIPAEKLPVKLIKVGKAYHQAGNVCDEAEWKYNAELWDNQGDTGGVAYKMAKNNFDKAWENYQKARIACDKAIKANMPLLEQLHSELCSNCTWNGKTIFLKEGEQTK